MKRLSRVNGIFLVVVGIILVVVALFVLNGLGGAGHTRADVFVALGALFIVVGGFVALTRP